MFWKRTPKTSSVHTSKRAASDLALPQSPGHQLCTSRNRHWRPFLVLRLSAPRGAGAAARRASVAPTPITPQFHLPHGTTIVALKYPGGVLLAGDRRSTQGNMIAGRDVQKVYITDDYTATGIAGTAAIAVEFARLYAVELEHYEKLEGVPLTFAGKVNRLAIMVRGNLAAAMQGLVALPLLAGFDIGDPDPEKAGRIVSFDAAGGWNLEEEGYQSVGSGSIFAKSSIKKLYSQVTDADSALRVAVEALYDAADDDSATGGPDLVRGIFPTAVTIGVDGAVNVGEQRIAELAREVIQARSRADTFGPDADRAGSDS